MLIAPHPEDDAERVAALCSMLLLDTAMEERFDRITRTARRLFGVSIALISLVDDDRQWFKSRSGFELGQTGHDLSFCGHAILGAALPSFSDCRERTYAGAYRRR